MIDKGTLTEYRMLKELADSRDIADRNPYSTFVDGLLNLMRFDYDEYMILTLGVEHAAGNTDNG